MNMSIDEETVKNPNSLYKYFIEEALELSSKLGFQYEEKDILIPTGPGGVFAYSN